MKVLRSFMLGLVALSLCSCGKKEHTLEKELSEAGYEMTIDGWHEVIRTNNVTVMKSMINGGFDPKVTTPEGRNGLHFAAESGSIDAADYLLDLGIGIDSPDNNGRTPLMLAVISDKTKMVNWLLNQRANNQLVDKDGYKALMLAVSHGSKGSIEELAPYQRQDMDSALLFAAFIGKPDAIDALTNFGASVHARFDDGRTPLMLAAQNGHMDAVKMLMEVGASRLATTENGDSAQSLAIAAKHNEIAEIIAKGVGETSLSLESDQEVVEAMQDYLTGLDESSDDQAAIIDEQTQTPATNKTIALSSIEGAKVSKPIEDPDTDTTPQALPLIMRHYHQRELPLQLKGVSAGKAKIRIEGADNEEFSISAGDSIPSSRLKVVKVFSRIESGKLNEGQPVEVGVLELQDKESGQRREWIEGRPLSGHDAVALVEDGRNGQRYIARPGQKFFSDDGREYVIIDVRPNQMIIEEISTGETTTLPLRGSRG